MMRLTNYFSVLDQYENWFDYKKDGIYYFTFIVESQHLKHKKIAFNSQLQSVSLCVEYAERQKDFEMEIIKHSTTMFVDPAEGETRTSCPFCFCPGEKMSLTDVDTDGLETYEHQCDFDEMSILDVIKEVNEVSLIESSSSGYLSGLTMDYVEGDVFGFSEDGSHYTVIDDKVFHYHFNEEDVYCGYCSQSEPCFEEGELVMQFCPVLTKKIGAIKKRFFPNS